MTPRIPGVRLSDTSRVEASSDGLSRHPELLEPGVDAGFFGGQRPRAWVGIALYAAGGVIGYLLAPPVALAIFVALPILYAVTDRGLPTRR
ncbi:MAG: hypothetical protein ACRDZO_03740 [Egibacteraceae bacterium]